MGAMQLLLGRWRVDGGLLVLLAVVVGTTAGLVGAVPRLLDVLERASLADELDRTTIDRKGLVAEVVEPTSLTDPDAAWQRLTEAGDELRTTMDQRLRDVLVPPVPVVDSMRYTLGTTPAGELPDPFVRRLVIRSQLDMPELDLVAGRLPDGEPDEVVVQLPGDESVTTTLHEVVLSEGTAEGLDLEVGDQRVSTIDPEGPVARRIVPVPTRTVVIEVAGIADLGPVEEPVWFGDARAHRPVQFDTDSNSSFDAVALVPPDAVGEIPGGDARDVARIEWRFELDEQALLASEPAPVAEAALALRTSLPLQLEEPRWDTSLDRLVAREAARRATAVEVLGLAVVAVVGVAIALLGAIGLVLATRRRDATALVRGRGTSTAQALVAAAIEAVAVAGVGGGGALWVLEVLLPRGGGELLVVGVAMLAAVVLVATSWPDLARPLGSLIAERRRREARASRSRPVLEGLILLLAVVAVIAARQRGVVVDGEVDPLVVAAPAAVALASAVVAARLVPLIVRVLGLLAVREHRGLAAPLGIARATRRRSGGPIVLLVTLGVGVAGIATTVHATIVAGQARAASEQVGADVRIDAPAGGTLTPDWRPPSPQDDVVELAVAEGAVVTETGGRAVDVVLVEAGELGLLDEAADLPPLGWDGASPAPMVVSSTSRSASSPTVGDTVALLVDGNRLPVRIVAAEPYALARDEVEDGPFVVVETDAVVAVTGVEPLPTTRLVRTDDAAAVAASARELDPQASVVVREEVQQTLVDAPLGRGVRIGFLVASAASATATLLAVVLALAAAAPVRRREAAVLAAVGTSRRAIAASAVAEVVPVVAVAAVAGIGLAFGVVAVLGDRLDLAAFTGTTDPATLGAPPLVAAVALVAAVVGVAGAAAVVTIGRVDTTTLLREGEG